MSLCLVWMDLEMTGLDPDREVILEIATIVTDSSLVEIDVSSIKELASRWRPDLLQRFKKQNEHRALADIRESIAELAFYRREFGAAESSGGCNGGCA